MAFLFVLGIGILAGALVGAGADACKQLIENNWNVEAIDWLSVVGSGLLGGALGAAMVLGGAAGMAYAGFAIKGYTLSTGIALAASTGVVSAGNMLNYSFKTHGNVTPEGLWEAAWKGALKGAVTFGLSFYFANHGLFLEKLHSDVLAQEFFFLRPGSVWVQNTFAYRILGELGLRTIVVSFPGALIRWFIDQW